MAKTSEVQLKAQKKYDSKYTIRYGMKLNINTDKDIIEKLESVESKQTYIKELIRADIRKNSI